MKNFEQLSFVEGVKNYPTPTKESKQKASFFQKFQRWSDKNFKDGTTAEGKCAYMNCCDYCNLENKTPCASALRKMIKKEKIKIDFSKSFEEIMAELDY